jgi:uncharacterized membrane protein
MTDHDPAEALDPGPTPPYATPRPVRGEPLAAAIDRLTEAIATTPALDGVEQALDAAHDALPPRWRELLRGDPLGHALHPVLTDLPIGFWTSASTLDLLGGRRARPAARRLVGLGVLSAVPTFLAGIAEFGTIRSPEGRRLAAAHAAANAAGTALYALSWRARRQHPIRGAAWAAAGAGVATAAGMLGGHLAFDLGIGASAHAGDATDRPSTTDAPTAPGLLSQTERTDQGDLVG